MYSKFPNEKASEAIDKKKHLNDKIILAQSSHISSAQ